MRVRIVPYAELRRQVLPKGEDVLWLDLPDGATVGDVLRLLDLKTEDRLIVGLDGTYATADMPLRDNSELTLVTPMQGGQPSCEFEISSFERQAALETRSLKLETG